MNMKAVKFLTFLIIAVVICGCANVNNESRKANLKSTAKMPKNMPVNNTTLSFTTKVFFYYSSKCPYCREVKPYMELLRKTDKNVKFYFCNVYDMKNCSEECKWLANQVKIKWVPTVIVFHGGWVKVFQGLNVTETGNFLHMFGEPIPKAKLNNTTYDVNLCINCHLKKGIKLPENYTCNYCCHLSKK